ncbi:MAG: MFS transporter [Pseudomonadota bacterium]
MSTTVSETVAGKRPLFFYGWVVVAVGFVTLGIAFGIWYSFSVFFLAIIKNFGWSRAAASSIFSVFIISQALTGLLAGHLQDRFGPRVVIPVGTVILSICLALTSQAQSLWHFYMAYGVFAGAGLSLLAFSSHSAFIPKWFERKRGLALGIAMSGIGFGMLLLVPLVEKSITAYGWRATYLYLSGLVLFVAGPLNVIFSRRRPEDLNLRPDGDDPEEKDKISRRSMIVKVVDQNWANQDWTLKKAIGTQRFWSLLTAFFFGSWVYQGILLHAISAMVDCGLQRESAAYYFGILGIVGAGGKILFGYLSDVLGRERITVLAGIFVVAGIFCLMGMTAGTGLLPLFFAILFGLGYGAAAPVFPSVCADIFLGNSFGLIFAVICIGGGVGGSLGAFISGYLRDVSGSYSFSFYLYFISIFLSCLFICLAGPGKVRRMVLLKRMRSM